MAIQFSDEGRIYSANARTNRRTKWRYSDYCGRWETVERAIAEVKDRYSEKTEYLIEDMYGNVVAKGFVND